MKILVVVNPIAGGGAAARGAERVVRHPGAHPSPAGLPAGWPDFAERLASVGGEAHGPFGPAEVGGVVLSIARRHAPDGRIVAAGADL